MGLVPVRGDGNNETRTNEMSDAAEIVKAALQNGIIKAADIELDRRPPPDAGAKLKVK